MTEGVFLELMTAAIAESDGSEAEALTMFGVLLLEKNDPRLVWDLFEPVRGVLLRKLYRQAQYQLQQASEVQPVPSVQSSVVSGTASEPNETADGPEAMHATQREGGHSAVSLDDRRKTIVKSKPRVRSQTSAQHVLMDVGGRKSHLDSIIDRHGNPVGNLNYYGLANMHDEQPIIQAFVNRLMEGGMPKSDRASDIARKFYTPDQADRWWLECLKAVA